MRTAVTDKTRVFAHERERNGQKSIKYSTNMGRKNVDGTYENSNSLYVKFGKKNGTPNLKDGESADIIIKSGWMDFFNVPSGEYDAQGREKITTRWGIFVNEWEFAQQNVQPQQNVQQNIPQQNSLPDSFAVDLDDMPM